MVALMAASMEVWPVVRMVALMGVAMGVVTVVWMVALMAASMEVWPVVRMVALMGVAMGVVTVVWMVALMAASMEVWPVVRMVALMAAAMGVDSVEVQMVGSKEVLMEERTAEERMAVRMVGLKGEG